MGDCLMLLPFSCSDVRNGNCSLSRFRSTIGRIPSIFDQTKRNGLGDAYLGVAGGTGFRCIGFATEKIERDPSFAAITDDDIVCFKEILGDNNVIQDEDRLSSANMDWMRKYVGSSQLLLLPRCTQEVSQILKHCSSRRLAVVPQGGNTGLVGGSVPVFDEVMNSKPLLQLFYDSFCQFMVLHKSQPFAVEEIGSVSNGYRPFRKF